MGKHKLSHFLGLGLGLVVSLNSRNPCHSEKIENLAFSVDFRLIQNLSMLIKAEVSLLGWKAQPTVTTIE